MSLSTIALLALSAFVALCTMRVHDAHSREPCPARKAVLLPQDGSVLPWGAAAIAFLHTANGEQDILVQSEGRDIVADIDVLSDDGSIRVVSIRPTEAVERFSVFLFEPGSMGHLALVGSTYYVSSDRPPVPSQAVSLEVGDQRYSGTRLATPNVAAVAYRVDWAETRALYIAGKRHSIVIPYDSLVYFLSEHKIYHRKPEIRLVFGYDGCDQPILPILDEDIYVGVTSIASDGTFMEPKTPTKLDSTLAV